jgi:para-aminobenzoate synthetase component 1
VSTSPERFIKRTGGHVETRPIKGTRPRSADPEADLRLKRELSESRKDDAELSMIVDLMRNDLGRVCRAGSVAVAEHKRVESYQNVHHLVSVVSGEPVPGLGPGRLLKAAFPGGSITGCPRIRAMEIIDELEPTVRHVYTGSIGYLGWEENLDLSVAIRTAIHKGGRCWFSVGGGVVHDSVDQDEYQETLDKARTLTELLRKLEALKTPTLAPSKNTRGGVHPRPLPVTSPLLKGRGSG